MSAWVEIVERGDRLIVGAPFNHRWRGWASANGGHWDAGSVAWVFPLKQREATVDADPPSDYAWIVHFRLGRSGWKVQDGEGFVRAVRPGQ